jgi:hypothetical protein
VLSQIDILIFLGSLLLLLELLDQLFIALLLILHEALVIRSRIQIHHVLSYDSLHLQWIEVLLIGHNIPDSLLGVL